MSEKDPHSPPPEYEQAQLAAGAEQQANDRQFAGETALRGLGRFFKRHHHEAAQSVNDESIDSFVQNPTEEATSDQPEVAPRAENYAFLDELLSPANLHAEKSRLQALIEADPLLSAFGSLYEANINKDRAWNAANNIGDRELANQLDAEAAVLRDQIKSYDSSVANRYIKLSESIRQINKNSRYVVAADSETGQTLLRALQAAASPKERDISAPFAHYAENDADSWRAVQKNTVLDYLSKKEFKQHGQPEDGTVILDSAAGKPFEVPLDLIKSAAGFEDWQGRKGSSKDWNSEYGSGKMSSLDVIEHYAGLPTELPTVGEIRVMVSPDGTLSCDNGSADSHRISAAILRGAVTVKANKLHFVRLPEN